MLRLRETPCHFELVGGWGEVFTELGGIDVEVCGIEFDAHEEEVRSLVGVLVGVENIAVVLVDEIGDGGHHPFAIGARNQQDGGVFHGTTNSIRGTRTFTLSSCFRMKWAIQIVYRRKCFRTSRAAFAPEPPVSPAPGCVPLPHKYRFWIGVRYRPQSSNGPMVKN